MNETLGLYPGEEAPDLLPCPFCGGHLEFFGHDRRILEVVQLWKHPVQVMSQVVSQDDICPLSSLVFTPSRWNRRFHQEES